MLSRLPSRCNWRSLNVHVTWGVAYGFPGNEGVIRVLSVEDNELITNTDRGTPMGELFRRYWIPALLAEELPGADCNPVRVRILGEDLVAFRDSKGKPGVIDAYCPHRGAPMFSPETKKRASVASITAGSSTPQVTASTCRTSPMARPRRTGCTPSPTRRSSRRT